MPEASLMSDRANASQLQDGPAAGQGNPAGQQAERGVRICESNNSADTKVSEEGGGGDAPSARAEIPLQPVVKTMQPMEVHGGEDFHLQPMEDAMPEQITRVESTAKRMIDNTETDPNTQ
ncbi:protein pxr1-like [Limosa lapponica baueri]|uniref:Protein pxr1-like n=1 Tax=Limosa lapponica baueri TaxID=1758121 RepID=A0A2I0TYH4_LIMLA|nr:protein pxr1-like [Limosa lapponica baueri]